MNNYIQLQNTSSVAETETNFLNYSEVFVELQKLCTSILDSNDSILIKGKRLITKSGFRKISIALNLSTKVVGEKRILKDEVLIYDFTVRAIAPNGRYAEASASCSSEERDFNHLNHDVRATAQTRASNRAISDLLGLNILVGEYEPKQQQMQVSEETEEEVITSKQRQFLIRLIEQRYDDEQTRSSLYKEIETMTKSEARIAIKNFIEGGEF